LKLKVFFFILVMALMAAQVSVGAQTDDQALIEKAHAALTKSLNEPGSTQFRNDKFIKGRSEVSGEVNFYRIFPKLPLSTLHMNFRTLLSTLS
jgi:hypothetical protein